MKKVYERRAKIRGEESGKPTSARLYPHNALYRVAADFGPAAATKSIEITLKDGTRRAS
jgi:uncharacterized protein (DUF1684 family)